MDLSSVCVCVFTCRHMGERLVTLSLQTPAPPLRGLWSSLVAPGDDGVLLMATVTRRPG